MEQFSESTVIFDLDRAQEYADTGRALFCKTFKPNDKTLYVAKLPHAVQGKHGRYQTGLFGINGKVVYCKESTCMIMRRFSRIAPYSYQLSQCLAEHLNVARYPYFCGRQSFVTEKSPRRGESIGWICSQWYHDVETINHQTWITFCHGQQAVRMHIRLSENILRQQLGLVRFMNEQAQMLMWQKQVLCYGDSSYRPSGNFDNLPLLPPEEQPLICTLEQVRNFQIEARCRRLTGDIVTGEGIELDEEAYIRKQLNPDFRSR